MTTVQCGYSQQMCGMCADISGKLQTTKVDTVSLPIALGLWLMMWPVLTKVRCLLQLLRLLLES